MQYINIRCVLTEITSVKMQYGKKYHKVPGTGGSPIWLYISVTPGVLHNLTKKKYRFLTSLFFSMRALASCLMYSRSVFVLAGSLACHDAAIRKILLYSDNT